MDQRSRDLYNNSIFEQAVRLFGGQSAEVVKLDGFENLIYEIQVEQQPRILRIAHSLHRTSNKIEGEIDWLNHLSKHGVNVAQALPSLSGSLVEVIPAADGSHFTAASFEKAPGHHPKREDWQKGLPEKLGHLLGRMNFLAQSYVVPDLRIKRPELLEDLEGFAEKYLPPTESLIIQKHNEVLASLKSLPISPESYGLIHQDAHGGNFFVQDGNITIFDFDDCLYAWYAYDIAMAFMYVLPLHCTEKDVDFGKDFLLQFLGGYTQVNSISHAWLTKIPLFLKLREIDLYIAIHRSMDLNDLDPWCADFMRDRKANIENDVPYFLSELNFESILP